MQKHGLRDRLNMGLITVNITCRAVQSDLFQDSLQRSLNSWDSCFPGDRGLEEVLTYWLSLGSLGNFRAEIVYHKHQPHDCKFRNLSQSIIHILEEGTDYTQSRSLSYNQSISSEMKQDSILGCNVHVSSTPLAFPSRPYLLCLFVEVA